MKQLPEPAFPVRSCFLSLRAEPAFLDKIGKGFYNEYQETGTGMQLEKQGVDTVERAKIGQFIHFAGKLQGGLAGSISRETPPEP